MSYEPQPISLVIGFLMGSVTMMFPLVYFWYYKGKRGDEFAINIRNLVYAILAPGKGSHMHAKRLATKVKQDWQL